ncbi:hypothetical protein EMIT0P265_180023 [Pseudomonas zeae]
MNPYIMGSHITVAKPSSTPDTFENHIITFFIKRTLESIRSELLNDVAFEVPGTFQLTKISSNLANIQGYLFTIERHRPGAY